MDHMLAFTRISAAATQRAIVRATNSGISSVVGPDGRVEAILTVPGDDGGARKRKMVAGALRATVPVPRRDAGAAAAPATFFVAAEPWLGIGFGALGLVILALCALASRGIATNSQGNGYPAS